MSGKNPIDASLEIHNTYIVISLIGHLRHYGWAACLLSVGVPAVAQGPTAENLAAEAVEEVTRQIYAATTLEQSLWASQPGAIRTFGAAGFPSRIYKLYSASRPIIGSTEDPSADVPARWSDRPDDFVDLNAPSWENGEPVFPIADPRAATGDAATTVEGFRYRAETEGVVLPAAGVAPDAQRLPMPVRWIYRLRDGSTGYLASDGRFLGTTNATAENPIVGRFAYWTDDDTSKINVNTASEGVYWDVPRCDTSEERAYANRQPAADEFQRLPGHPARVCLSSVLFPGRRWYLPGTGGDLTPLGFDELQTLWALSTTAAPRGTRGGTESTNSLAGLSAHANAPALCFGRFVERVPASLQQRATRSEFFLTTSNRAPELNAFGRPRLSMWPLRSSSGISTGFDNATQAMNRVGNSTYVVTHRDSDSVNNEYYQLNSRQANYLRAQLAGRIPGRAQSLALKFGPHADQDAEHLIVGAIGRIRATNLIPFVARGSNEISYGQVSPLCACGGSTLHNHRLEEPGVVLPRESGRFPAISEVALHFICLAERTDSGLRGDPAIAATLPSNHRSIGVALVLETFTPTHGYTGLTPNFAVRVTGPDQGPPPPVRLNGEVLDVLRSTLARTSPVVSPPGTISYSRPWGANGGIGMLAGNPQPVEWSRLDPDSTPPLPIGATVAVPTSDSTMEFGGLGVDSQLVLRILDSPDSSRTVQTIRLAFPPTTLPVPEYTDPDHDTFAKRGTATGSVENTQIREGDVIRSLVPSHGDYRLVLSRLALDEHVFQPHPEYFGSGRLAHALTRTDGSALPGNIPGRGLVADAEYPDALRPDFPVPPSSPSFAPRIPGGYHFPVDPALTGDWDNGLSLAPDGAYVGMGDEGMLATAYFDAIERPFPYPPSPVFSSPYRMTSSAVTLGSLASGTASGIPWRTLLFRPQSSHFGASDPPDHLWLDLFWMPKVTRQTLLGSFLAEPFVSEGMVNLNHRIAPFSYLTRATALHALLKSQKILAIPTSAGPIYKSGAGDQPWRHHLDAGETLRQWEGRFFRTASELCEQYLVPEGESLEGMPAFWDAHRLTGDNTRERPYADLYGLVTTKSNSYTTHVIAQAIRKGPGSPPERIAHALDTYSPPFRGEAFLRRVLDGRDARIPDYLATPDAPSLESLYRIEAYGFPALEKSPFRIRTITEVGDARFQITWSTVPERCERVEFSTDLVSWTPAGDWMNTRATTMAATVSPVDISGPTDVYFRIVRW